MTYCVNTTSVKNIIKETILYKLIFKSEWFILFQNVVNVDKTSVNGIIKETILYNLNLILRCFHY